MEKAHKKYFVVCSPTEQYYPWMLDNGDSLLFNSIEEAKEAIARMSIDDEPPEEDDFWIGERVR